MFSNQNIIKTYSGKIGCMCGCKGKYNYTQHGAQTDGPGYPVNVSERGVRIIASRVLNDSRVVFDGDMAYVEDRVANKIQVVYFKGA
jgi:hypothetical protein